MPRGKVIKRSLDEQIELLEEDIRIAQGKVNKLQEKWKELQRQKREQDMEGLYSLIKESGLSMDTIRTMITEASEKEAPEDSAAEIA